MEVSSVAQLITVLILFVAVLVLTYYVTKWIAKYQQVSTSCSNMEIVETMRLSASKYMQIVRVSDKYLVIGVCKDTITLLAELSSDDYTPPAIQKSEVPEFSKELAKVMEKFKKK
jgi:flagellar protein FliO/FliZ